jgi:hypothetical protein
VIHRAWADAKLLGDLPHALSAAWLVQARMRGLTISKFVSGMCWISLRRCAFWQHLMRCSGQRRANASNQRDR